MRFYTKQHSHYCGIDLHTRTMYLCILNQAGAIVLHRNMRADPDSFLKAIAPFGQDIVVAVECIFTWYWLADLCAREKIHFVDDLSWIGSSLVAPTTPAILRHGSRVHAF